ncbi:hypothetical protein Pmani_010643 [Petrolisthes manimaculis]|uniref:Uncharacterized protein n=1 Tax=Petrolisthes manimaculis TaxID=1843537 RepID=A0AAE1Q115_9EUCA|nr:hypothetical protein Pmani_010643 [Petrolisthes manimaculis]
MNPNQKFPIQTGRTLPRIKRSPEHASVPGRGRKAMVHLLPVLKGITTTPSTAPWIVHQIRKTLILDTRNNVMEPR